MDEEILIKAFEVKSLSKKDRQNLNKQYWLIAGFSMFSGGIFFLIFTNVISGSHLSSLPLYIFGVFAVIFASFIAVLLRQNYLELKHGIKHCYTGVVTNKRVNRHTSSTGNNVTQIRNGHGSRRRTTRTTYYITIAEKEFGISASAYNQVNTGDMVYLEISPKKKQLLEFRVLTEHLQEDSNAYSSSSSFVQLGREKECAMSAKERLIVQRIFFKAWRKKLYFFLAIAIFFIPVLTTGLILFTAPLTVVLIVYAYKLVVPLMHYRHFLHAERPKIISTVQVKDKTTLTSNRSRIRYRLMTSGGPLDVPEDFYSGITKSDVLSVHQAACINTVFGVEQKHSNALVYLD